MRLLGKSELPQSGYPWMGVVVLLGDMKRISNKKTGNAFCTAFAMYERQEGKNAAINLEFPNHLTRKVLLWPKKTVLFVAGTLQIDDYWTKRNGKEEYVLRVEFVLTQPDYASLQNYQSATASKAGDLYQTDYDPGF